MTREQYSKATDILVDINHYRDIIDTLRNSKGNELIARKSDGTITNIVHIREEPILQVLINVIEDEISILELNFQDS